MFAHAGQGYAGHGTLCGALGVSSCLINLVLYNEDYRFTPVIDRMMYWYAGMKFPTDRFDDISAFPKQVQVQAMTPLCHSSVSKWTLAAGEEVTSKQKYERCAKVAGEVVYTVAHYLNEYFDGKWKPAKWTPSKQIESCAGSNFKKIFWRWKNRTPKFPHLLHSSRHLGERLSLHRPFGASLISHFRYTAWF